MKAWLFRPTLVLIVVLLAPTGVSLENLGIRNPISSGPSTIPQSSISGGLVNTPNPIDTTGNLLITGNVRRGLHFRGNVPYQSPTSFSATLGSSSLSSFLRDTAGPEDFGSRSQRYGAQPYYSATETVTTTRPGRAEVVSPTSAMVNTRMQQDTRTSGVAVMGSDAPLAEPMPLGRDTAVTLPSLGVRQTQQNLFGESRLTQDGYISHRTSQNSRDVRELTSDRAGIGLERETLAAEQYRERNLQADPGLWRESQVLSRQKQERSLTTEGLLESSSPAEAENVEKADSQRPTEPATDWPGIREPLRTDGDRLLTDSHGGLLKRETSDAKAGAESPSVTGEGLSSQESFGWNQRDVLEKVRQQLEVLTRSVETSLQSLPGEAHTTTGMGTITKSEKARREPSDNLGSVRTRGVNSGSTSGLYDAQRLTPGLRNYESARVSGIEEETDLVFPETSDGSDSQDKASILSELGQMSQAEISTEARRILGPHTNLESLSQAKFSEHIRDAQEHLRAGRYYRAADSFALAAVYKPDDPAVLAGQSHALFAAGEYMSSALFLSRTLSVFPEYTQVDVDLAALLGGQDKMARRLADIEQWYARSGSGQLQFLLSYVYYRMGRLIEAKRAIEAAYQKMPQLPAVRTMKAAIDAKAK